jgi:RNA polymerase sigma-70 factor (ECF subfamily)
MRGREAVARALLAFYRQAVSWHATLVPARINGQPGFRALDPAGRLINVVALDIADGEVHAVRSVLNPDKLAHLGPLSDLNLRPSGQAAARGER